MLYQIVFKDGTKFDGGVSYKETLWNKMPEKEIQYINFILPDGNFITLRGYETYNHFIEATQNIYGSTKFTLKYQYLMGRLGDKVVSYRINLFETTDSKYKIGDISRREYIFGQEYYGKPTSGWKGVVKP